MLFCGVLAWLLPCRWSSSPEPGPGGDVFDAPRLELRGAPDLPDVKIMLDGGAVQ